MDDLVYLGEYILQKDMRIRLPKSVLENLNAVKGETMFSILLDKKRKRIILKPASISDSQSKKKENGEKDEA